MYKKLNILTAILIIISILTTCIPVVNAAEGDTDVNCANEMKTYTQQKSAELRTYFNEHFSNKNTNSSLLDLGLKRFDEYKRDLNKKYETYFPQAGLSVYTESLDKLKCYTQMNQEITLMEKLLKSYFAQSSEVKTTSAMLEKLKAINKKLDELLKSLLQMYGKFVTLKGRIPCYTKQCV